MFWYNNLYNLNRNHILLYLQKQKEDALQLHARQSKIGQQQHRSMLLQNKIRGPKTGYKNYNRETIEVNESLWNSFTSICDTCNAIHYN